MTDEDTQTIFRLVRDQALCEQSRVMLNTSLADELFLDSLDFTELVMEVEDEFDIAIEDERWQKVTHVRDIVACVEETRAAA